MWSLRHLWQCHKKPYRVGWITYGAFPTIKHHFRQLDSFNRIRAGNIGEWINANNDFFYNELYQPQQRYDIVVFQKMMDQHCQVEAERIQRYGGKIIFDANVNYYEIWGEYDIPGTKPTSEEQRDAIWMTSHADWVVADSSYIASVARRFNANVTWIPDCVNLRIYRGNRKHLQNGPLTLVWSGVAKKAQQLLQILEIFRELKGVELILVAERPPEAMHSLQQVVPCRYVRFNDRTYAQLLRRCDIIISPKRLCNGYEMGHTEYKISLGMAVGLPAVASPQQSYQEIINLQNGGIIADTTKEWTDALIRLSTNHHLRAQMGEQARQTVIAYYSVPVISQQYLNVLKQLLNSHVEKNH